VVARRGRSGEEHNATDRLAAAERQRGLVGTVAPARPRRQDRMASRGAGGQSLVGIDHPEHDTCDAITGDQRSTGVALLVAQQLNH
jgi:hypothetical protein